LLPAHKVIIAIETISATQYVKIMKVIQYQELTIHGLLLNCGDSQESVVSARRSAIIGCGTIPRVKEAATYELAAEANGRRAG
jgi:hypothetical protein